MKKFMRAVLAALFALALGAFAQGDKVVIGYSISTLNNAFFVGMTKGVENGAKKFGVELITVNANGDSAKQAADVEDLITKGVDAIIINPRDAEAIAPAVKKALDAGIPVFALDRGVTGVEVTSFLETDNVAMGRLAADLIAEAMKAKYGEVKGNVIELVGLVGTTAARDRGKGFHEQLKKYPGLKLVAAQPADFNQEKAFNVTSNLVLAHPDVDAIYGHNDDNTVGAARALKAMGFTGTRGQQVVLTGGGAQLPGLADYAQSALGRPVRIGSPPTMLGLPQGHATPSSSTLVGLILHAASDPVDIRKLTVNGQNGGATSLMGLSRRIMRALKDYF